MLSLLLTQVCFAVNPADVNEEVEPLEEVEVAPRHGEIVFDSRLPAEIQLDGQTVAQLFVGGHFIVRAAVGTHDVTVLTNGTPRQVWVDVPAEGRATVLVGRTGLTTGHTVDEADAEGAAKVEFRVASDQQVLVQLDGDRYRIDGNGYKGIVVPVGSYKMSVRSGNGTVIWASGRLELKRATDVVVQLSEGRMPEVSGGDSRFFPGG